jgi:hypothetical protein
VPGATIRGDHPVAGNRVGLRFGATLLYLFCSSHVYSVLIVPSRARVAR